MRTEVRPARTVDIGALCWLEDEARADVALRRGGPQLLADHARIGDRWSTLIGGQPPQVLLAMVDEVPVGYLVLEPVAPRGTARVQQIWVSPGAREVGLGDELLATAIEVARGAGATAIEAEALPGDRETKNLYERAGVTARKLVVWKVIGPKT